MFSDTDKKYLKLALAVVLLILGSSVAATVLWRQAVAADSNFAMAHAHSTARLGQQVGCVGHRFHAADDVDLAALDAAHELVEREAGDRAGEIVFR